MYEIYERLLKAKGLSTADVCKATGISQSTMSNWKKRQNNLSTKNAQKVADFLGVSINYLMTGEDDQHQAYYLNDETAKMAQELFENKDMRVLFSAARGAKPEDLKTAADVLLALKRKEGYNGDDPA
jgi:transcriptional regulator with XRE-family HTH domain